MNIIIRLNDMIINKLAQQSLLRYFINVRNERY